MAQLIDGKAISQQIKDELKAEVEALKNDGTDICLAVIQVGDDPASSVYVRNKKRACAYIGVESRAYELPEDTTEEQLVELVKELNADDTVNGILVQLPLPAQIDEDKIIRTISADKDVDGREGLICCSAKTIIFPARASARMSRRKQARPGFCRSSSWRRGPFSS